MAVEKLFPEGLPVAVEGVPPVVVATGRRGALIEMDMIAVLD